MARGGYRPGAGRPRKNAATVPPKLAPPDPPAAPGAAEAPAEAPLQPAQTPLAYMLDVMNDPGAEVARRDRMAIAAAPFMHPRVAEESGAGKREKEAEAARQAATGKFAPPAPPRLVVDNK